MIKKQREKQYAVFGLGRFGTSVALTLNELGYQVMGVDTDEEAMDLMKFQQAYNLNSKMMSVMNEIYDKLINQTGL
mgnify:CR=1 FL=1